MASVPIPVGYDPVFGSMVGAHHVDWAIQSILKAWDRTYLQETARISSETPDQLVPIRNWRISSELERMPEDQTPTCIIANKGLFEPPVKRNFNRPGQSYQATWRYQIGVHVSARGRKQHSAPRAVTLAKMYVLALRVLLIQKRDEYSDPDMRRVLGMIDWIDENYDGLDSDADRTICLSYAEFLVTSYEVSTWGTGPKVPVLETDPADPGRPIWPLVDEVVLNIVKVPTDEPIDDVIPPLFDPSPFGGAFTEAFDDDPSN